MSDLEFREAIAEVRHALNQIGSADIAAMSPEQIDRARVDGRLAYLLAGRDVNPAQPRERGADG